MDGLRGGGMPHQENTPKNKNKNEKKEEERKGGRGREDGK